VKFSFHILDSVVTMILNVVDGVDLATKEGSEDVIRLHPTGRRSCDSGVTE